MAESVMALYDKKSPIGVRIIIDIHIPNIGDASPSFTDFSPMVDMM